MSLFDTNLVKRPFTLSSYTIVEGVDSTMYFASNYHRIFKKEVYYKDGYFVGISGVIDMIGKIPIDYLHEYKNGIARPIRRFIKNYTTKDSSFYIKESQGKYTFVFEARDGVYNAKCIINVYAR